MLLTRHLALLLLALLPTATWAQRESTRESMVRMEEVLANRLEDGNGLSVKDLLPMIVVSVKPAWEETKAWYPTAALGALTRVFGAAGLRSCEACMVPRVYAEDGRLEENSGDLDSTEIVRLDQGARGTAAPARSAVWLDENAEGVSLKIVDLRNGRIVLAENFDSRLTEAARTRKNFTLSRELDRRARGDAITQTFIDFTVFPAQHFSFDWTEQWGDTNANLSGVTLSLFDPLLGVGACYYRVIPPALNLMVGAKLILSVPTALVAAISGQAQTVVDPLFSAVLVVRLPIASSNFGVTMTLSTNGRFGIGISLLNVTLLPFLP